MRGFKKIIFITLLIYIGEVFSTELTSDPPKCVNEGIELWPHINPNLYWFCEDLQSAPKLVACPEGRGFLRIEGTVSGCIPWSAWECTTKVGKPECTGNNYFKPHKHQNPNKFWACTEEEPGKPSVAVEADCLDFPVNGDQPKKGTRGFVDNKDNLGCVPWDFWVCDKAGDTNRS